MLILNSSPKWHYFNLSFSHPRNHLSSNRKKSGQKKFSDLLGHKEHQPQRIYTKSFAARGLIQLPSDLLTILPILKLVVILSEKKPSKNLQEVISCLLWFILSKILNI